MIRVRLAGRDATAVEAFRARLDTPAIGVTGTSVTVEHALATDADVVVSVDGSVADRADAEGGGPALLVVGDAGAAPLLALAGHPAWGIVARDAVREEVVAAVTALAHGLIVAPPAAWPVSTPLEDDGGDELLGEPLTPREREVLEMASRGLSNRAIGDRLGISEHTVKFHLASIYGKLGASSRTGAVRRGVRRGLISI